jgi:uncharacterized protein
VSTVQNLIANVKKLLFNTNMNDSSQNASNNFFIALTFGMVIALGMILGGWFISDGLYHARLSDKYVSVKGLAEQRVKSDLAIWNIAFKATGDDLQQVNQKINGDQKLIVAFLSAHGFSGDEVALLQTTAIDQFANEYSSGNKPEHRYIINSGIQVRSTKVDLIRQVSGLSGELITQNIVLDKDYSANPRYLFTKLDSIRPMMLEAATKSALAVAEQFAKNSDTHLGSIRRANQGVFQILSADSSPTQQNDNDQEGSSLFKTVRVVSSIDYFLGR